MRLISGPLTTLALVAFGLLVAACTEPIQWYTPTPLPEGVVAITDVTTIPNEHYGAATATLEERVYLADVVVKASFVSAASGVLRFNALEYVKGTGPKKFSVRANTGGRSTQWDSEDAILFLSSIDGESAVFEFTDTTSWDYVEGPLYPTQYNGSLPEGYTVESRNPVWLPIESTTESSLNPGRSTPSGTPAIITDYSSGGTAETVTQADLRRAVAWVSGSSSAGQGLGSQARTANTDTSNREYQACVVESIMFNRDDRDYEAYYGESREPPVHEKVIESGSGKGVTLLDYGVEQGRKYNDYWVFGRDADLFISRRPDNDDDPSNGYGHDVITARPLPSGTYRFKHYLNPGSFQVCRFQPENAYSTYVVTVTAPAGTVHEAFFDPATTTAGVGYLAGSATTTGVLEPAGFSMRGRDINLTGLEWRNGQVVLSFDRTVQLSDGLTFIETDGTAGLYLSQFDATEDLRARTVTWQVSEQPWESGDELMLRIGSIPLPGVRNVTAERGSDGEVVLSWEVDYTAGVNGYRIWRYLPWRDEAPRVYVGDTLSTDTTYTDVYASTSDLAEYSVQAIGRGSDAGERSEGVPVGGQ